MVDVNEKILTKYPDVSLLLQIHDDLVFEIPDKDASRSKEIIKAIQYVLCSVYPLSVPLIVDVRMGKRWGELEKNQD